MDTIRTPQLLQTSTQTPIRKPSQLNLRCGKRLAPGRSSVTVPAIEHKLTAHFIELENELVLYYNYKFGIFIRLFVVRYTLSITLS